MTPESSLPSGDPSGLPRWAGTVHMHGSSLGRGPDTFVAGRDLVLSAPPAHALELARGALLDDWLPARTRAEIDSAAVDDLRAWCERNGEALTVDGVPLAWIHQGELYADVFLHERRILTGVRAAFRETAPASVELRGFDRALAAALAQVLDELGVRVSGERDVAAAPRYPMAFATSVARRTPVVAQVRSVTGLPGRPRGSVFVRPYRNLAPVIRRLLAQRPGHAVLDPFDAPPLARGELLSAFARGGWVGHPGARARRRSRALVERALAATDPIGDVDPLERLVATRARALLGQRARDTVADVAALRAAFGRRCVRSALVPSDGSPAGRSTVLAASESGVRSVHVQHGFFGDLWHGRDGRIAPFVDGLVADVAAVWSAGQRDAIADEAHGEVVVTGNPAATLASSSSAPRRHAGRRTALVLVQPPVGASAMVDVRAPVVHARAALDGLARAGFRAAVLRPHPLDPCGYEGAVLGASGLSVRVDRSTPLERAFAAADACVGCLSTATLEAAVAGVPTVFLETLGAPSPWPLDGSGAFPAANSAGSLAAALPAALDGDDVPGSDAAASALGVHGDAVERVLDLLSPG